MNHSPKLDLIRLEDSREERQRCIAAVQDYCARTGLNYVDLGRAAGYANSTFRMFMADRYQNISGNSTHIVRACREYMEAHPILPVRDVTGELFETQNVRDIRETFQKLLIRPRAFMIYAPPGSQKTFVLENEVRALNLREQARGDEGTRAFFVRARQSIRPLAMLKRIAVTCGTSSVGDADRVLSNLRMDHSRRRTLLIVDEAQLLSIECFEYIRELLDCEPHMSLLFAGSHDLFLKFERSSATLEQWNSRIAQKVRLKGCSKDEARGIVEREIGSILDRKAAGEKRKRIVDTLIAKATVEDAYVVVPEGQPKATYLNIRTLCNALDDLRMQDAATEAQKASAA